MSDVPVEVERASLMLEMVRAERQAAAALAALRAASPGDREAAAKALEHAYDRLTSALASYVAVLDVGGEEEETAEAASAPASARPGGDRAGSDAADQLAELVRTWSASVEELRRAIATHPAATAGTAAIGGSTASGAHTDPAEIAAAPADPSAGGAATTGTATGGSSPPAAPVAPRPPAPRPVPVELAPWRVLAARLDALESDVHALQLRLRYLETAGDERAGVV